MAEWVRCPCGNILARYVAGCFVVTRAGRELVSLSVVSITCERCGRVWRPSDSAEGDQVLVGHELPDRPNR